MSLFTIIVVGLWSSGYLIEEYEGGNLDVLKDALVRDRDGKLALVETAELRQLRRDVGDLWFVVHDRTGQELVQGTIPPQFTQTLAILEHLSDARLTNESGRANRPDAIVKWQQSAAGDAQIFSGTQGRMSFKRMLTGISAGLITVIFPVFVAMVLATLAMTPFVVRFALRGIGRAADQAAQITYDKRGIRISTGEVPDEIRPLVSAVNDALSRLDKGHAIRDRFLAQAAHELRTPIAILNARVAALPPSPEKTQLLLDSSRLAVLGGQLLDLQRLNHTPIDFLPIELVTITGRVVFDLAPLAFAAGYEMSFEPGIAEVTVQGDQTSIERAITNLVQNAIDHGGGTGTIKIMVQQTKTVIVSDEGAGIPAANLEEIFEPFNRLAPHSSGAGLGLNLVKEIMEWHNGTILAENNALKGACFTLVFPR
ncbi:ATP-binding protein [Phyllobacterium myrsinacearum]|uniref:histidine kinase n=1 Tax=Phyllobacterium myrsinacearum TaxID=28101 RepID=A0A839EWA8_9HYPH|nr:signal transduction histidine kinase [Phyllobacterium myrsinacearum]